MGHMTPQKWVFSYDWCTISWILFAALSLRRMCAGPSKFKENVCRVICHHARAITISFVDVYLNRGAIITVRVNISTCYWDIHRERLTCDANALMMRTFTEMQWWLIHLVVKEFNKHLWQFVLSLSLIVLWTFIIIMSLLYSDLAQLWMRIHKWIMLIN